MPLFTITPATLAWSPLFAGYYSFLGMRCAKWRVATGYMLGEKRESAVKSDKFKAPTDAEELKNAENKLQVATRMQANFNENVPMAMILLAAAELNGAPTWLVHTAYGVLFAARIAHAEFGLAGKDAVANGRLVGFLTSNAIIVGTGIYNFILGFDALKAFLSA